MLREQSITNRLAMQIFWIIAGAGIFLIGARSAFSQTSPNTLYNFTSGYPTGASPAGTLIQDSHGVLYGVTAYGGASLGGTIYKMTTTGAVTTIFNFSRATNGPFYPFGQLAVDSSGNIYGTTRYGGAGSDGVVYELTPSGSPAVYSLTILHNFTGYNSSNPSLSDGATPNGGVSLYFNMLCGTTTYGGINNEGTVWTYNHVNATPYVLLYNFGNNSQDGIDPQTAPIFASDGRMYGVTYAGGVNGVGTIYSANYDGTSYDNYSFTGNGISATGSEPVGRLVETGGALYGMCYLGANDNAGNVFKFTHSGGAYSVSSYYSFDGEYGGEPFNRLAVDSGENLYGFTTAGGIYGYGTAFKLPTTGSSAGIPALLHSFNGVDAQFDGLGQPGPYLASDGNLYGVSDEGGITATLSSSTPGGYGAAFKLTPKGGFTSLASFHVQGFYHTQYGSVVQAPDGNFYGDTSNGGAYGDGALYRSDAAGNIVIVHNFYNNTDGYYPGSTPTVGQDGALYGQTSTGGLLGYGTIWRCTTSGIFSIVRNLNYQDGNTGDPMFQAVNKTFYGTMQNGGFLGQGTAFSCTTSGIFTILHNFGGSSQEGSNPQGIYYEDSSGYLYGICYQGGTTSYGSLWKMKEDGSGFTILHGFGDGTDGSNPHSMIAAPGGILYGCCNTGGSNGYGTVWSYDTVSNSFSVLNSFSNSNGNEPTCLLLGPDGNLYGTTLFDGVNSFGELFEISTATPYSITPLYSLNGGSDGAYPGSLNLTLGSDGYFYTTPGSDGLDGLGTLLALNDASLANAVNITSDTGVSSSINVTAKTATVSIKNNGKTTLLGPIQLVVTRTSNPSGLVVTNLTGTVPAPYAGSGSPYLTVPSSLPHDILSLVPGKTVKVVVHLSGAVTSSTTLSALVYTGRF